MFTPEKMEQIQVVFSTRDTDKVALTLVQLGTLQMTDAAELAPWAESLERKWIGEEEAEKRKMRESAETALKELGLGTSLGGTKEYTGDALEAQKRLESIQRKISDLKSGEEKLEEEMSRLRSLRMRMEESPGGVWPLHQRGEYSYLSFETGRMALDAVDVLKERLGPLMHIWIPLRTEKDRVTFLLIGLKSDEGQIRQILHDMNIEPGPEEEEMTGITPEALRQLEKTLRDSEHKAEEFQASRRALAEEYEAFLKSLLLALRREMLVKRIQKYFRHTERTCLISGWLPTSKRDPVILGLKKATQNRCVIKEIPAESIDAVKEGRVQVPVKMKNPSFFRPFELLTRTYGTPSYTSIDPTPILGISFLLMFGMMFGDVGHGLVLVLAGLFLALRPGKPFWKSAGVLVVYAGAASVLFGFLFGSIFGFEGILPALWGRPMESIQRLFKVAIFFGAGMITAAMLINIVNGIRCRDFTGLIFDKAGLLAAILYWCSIVVAMRVVTTQAEARGEIPILVFLFMGAALLLLFLREPIVHLLKGKRRLFPEGVTTGIMGGIVELLEILLGFLANTVSYIRVAAFGLAHAGLFMAIFALSDAVRGKALGIPYILVLVFGNVLIICLEGLVVSIQAVRLEFYEFFSRFFRSTDIDYKPIETEL